MDSKEDEEISIDFSKIKKFFKSDKKDEDKKADENTQGSSEKIDKKDDEINIDLSKIKNFFKSHKKDDARAEHAAKLEHEDEEFSFDLSKIKKFFRAGVKEAKEDTAGSDEEISVNWSKVIEFFKKYGVVFIALIPIILSIYIRVLTGSLAVTDDWAANSVINSMRSQIKAGIDQQYPNLPDANKNALVETELQKRLSQGTIQIGQQTVKIDDYIRGTSNYFREFFQDENKKNYMPDIDPYYWFRYAKNILDHGHPGDILKDGKPFDNHQLAPVGRFVFPDMFHPYFLAYFYKFLHFFAPDLTLIRSMFYYPILVSALCVLLVFLIARKIGGNIGGFFAGLMMAVNAAFLGRTLSPDNDAWNIFFTLIITWFILETLEEENIIKIIILSLLGGFFTGLFTFEWSGWWFIFDFLLATIGFTFLYLVLTNFSEVKKNAKFIFSNPAIRNILIVGILYFLSTLIFVTLFSRLSYFKSSFLSPFSFPSIKAPVVSSLWPNVFTTVAELNEGSINSIINSIGGQFLFFISLLGLVLSITRKEGIKKFDFVYIIITSLFYGAYFLFRRMGFDISVFGLLIWVMLPIFVRICISIYKRDSSYDFKLPILLSLWVVSTIFASIKGIRFTVLLAPAFSVAFGVAFGKIYIFSSKYLTRELKIHKIVTSSILIVLLLLVYVNPTRGAISAARSNLPLVNDAWYNALIAIKQDSKEDAIITSWWDFGHHFKAIADRRVTFDGTTQTSPAAHWVGELLMTGDERQSIGILRMLDCGHNQGFNELFAINNNTHKSLKILNEIILLDKENARKKLIEYGLAREHIDKVLQYTHCNPPEAYFIASEDMIGKSGVWSHFGGWNFERADIWQNARKMPQEKAIEYMVNRFNYTKERAENAYYEVQAIASDSEANTWVAPWPGYGGTTSCSKDKEIYACSNGFQINLSTHDVFATGQQGIVRPKAAAFATEDGIVKKEFNGTTLDFGLTIIPKSESELQVVLSSKELTGSIFTRMFYMQGHGFKYFKLFNHQRGLTGTDIYTYKVDWEGRNTTIVKEYADFFKKPVKEETIKNIELKSSNITNATSVITDSTTNISNINITNTS